MEIIKQFEELIVLIKEQPQEEGIAIKILADKARKLIEEAKKSPKQDESLLNQLENIIKQMEEKSNQGAHHLCKKAWDKLLTILEAFKVYVQNQEERLKQVEEKLEDKEEKLALGHVAWMFEQAVAKYVLPEGTKITRFGAFNQMTTWLYKNNKKDKIIGREKWSKLQKLVKWNENHPKLMESLRESRNKIAHEDVDLEKVKTQAKDNLSDDQYRYFLDIVLIIEKTREMGYDSSSVPPSSRRRREAPPAGSTSKKRKI